MFGDSIIKKCVYDCSDHNLYADPIKKICVNTCS